jgi:plastocyanin
MSGFSRDAATYLSGVVKRSLLLSAGLACLVCCTSSRTTTTSHSYVPRVREITVTTVPLLVREQQSVFPFLAKDFGKGGVLEGKEVYAFSPSTVTVAEGDTIHFTLINPEDDDHSFVLPDLLVPLPPQQTTRVTYVAKHAGIYPILCAIPKHLPMMSGQLIVLAGTSMAD